MTPASTFPDWYGTTIGLLNAAIDTRDSALVRRAAIRIDSPEFDELPKHQQEQLLALYGLAMSACGILAP